ncbi:MAG: Ppx/GppA family phosphatase, partial [Gammaproteobacteria bacterium]|nr:Ppx/GppA family phosphatase [Gammaproteobacteria bacterium]
MIVGELRHGQLTIIDRLKETVRLSEGLDTAGTLIAPARQRALDCLSRFGERLRDMHASNVRAAGTSTLRRAKDAADFCKAAEQALGHPIEIISGLEEARLIYGGVTHSMPLHDGQRLVIDIGGGSTELIMGQGDRPRALESLHMGCVLMTERHFPGGRISKANFDSARMAVRLKMRPVKAFFRDSPETEAVGTSGTILATAAVARALGIVETDLTPEAVEALIERVTVFEHVDALNLPGLPERRGQVWPGGLAILAELMHVLRVDRLKTSDGALREGLLYDLIGRLQHRDARERSVSALARRFNVDRAQAKRVSGTGRRLLAQCAVSWELTSPLAADMLDWAARLHEIGLDISHDGFQRHGAYIAEHADLPGFPRSEQLLLAFLIASQRREIDRGFCDRLPAGWRPKALRLAILLRLAVLLNRSRTKIEVPNVKMTPGEESLELIFAPGWLAENPLTVADLDREAQYL